MGNIEKARDLIIKNYCEKNKLNVVSINKINYNETTVDCMNENNKFFNFKVVESIEERNGDLYCNLKIEGGI